MSLLLRSCSVLHCLGPYISPTDPHTHRGGRRRKEKEKQLTSNFGFLSLLLQNGPRDRGEMNGEPRKGRIYAQRTYSIGTAGATVGLAGGGRWLLCRHLRSF